MYSRVVRWGKGLVRSVLLAIRDGGCWLGFVVVHIRCRSHLFSFVLVFIRTCCHPRLLSFVLIVVCARCPSRSLSFASVIVRIRRRWVRVKGGGHSWMLVGAGWWALVPFRQWVGGDRPLVLTIFYHITTAYPIKALCCIASTFSLATFHCIL